jgi:signal transduction histidine kinase
MKALEKLWKGYAVSLATVLTHWPKRQIIVFLLFLSFLLAGADYLVRSEITLVVFYAIPVVAMAWLVGRSWAYAQACVVLCFVFLLNTARGAHGPASYINIGNRLVFYIFLIEVLTKLKFLQQNLESLAANRAQALAAEAARSVRLEREMLEAGEREQRRIGQDLHDGLCQHLTGTALASQVLVERLPAGGPVQGQARKIVELIEGGITLARGIAKGLYPIEMQNDGLMLALEDFTANTSDLFGIRCRFECNLPVLVDDPSTAAHLYRIAQEAVNNAVRHGRATEIEIALEESDSGIRLSVSDNGAGFPDPLPRHDGMGLRTMADRARSIGGHFSIHPGMLGGAEVICVAPAGWIT